MALGSLAISGGMSKQEKERLMYMDGKLVWSAAMGSGGVSSATAPDEVDYIVARALSGKGGIAVVGCVRIARGCTGNIPLYYRNANSSGYDYGKITFTSAGKISYTYPSNTLMDTFTVEGYQYI